MGEHERPEPAAFAAPSPPSEAEFLRWYWTVAELRVIAKALGVPGTGSKAHLTGRIAARLGGRPTAPEPRAVRSRIPAPLSAESVIPSGVILDRALQDWFRAQLGSGFRADAHLRGFLRGSPGATLGDALAHWRATRDAPAPTVDAQFEYNRFMRHWRVEHPGASHAEVVAAWRSHRSRPIDPVPEVRGPGGADQA